MKTERLLLTCTALLLAVASLCLTCALWWRAADTDLMRIPHLCIAVVTVLGIYAFATAAVNSWGTGRIGRCIAAVVGLVLFSGCNILFQSGVYMHTERVLSGRARAAEQQIEQQQEARQFASQQAEEAEQLRAGQLAALDQQIAATQANIDNMVARSMVSKANEARPALQALLDQRAQLATSTMTVSMPTSAPQPTAAAYDAGALDALFCGLSDLSGRRMSSIRAAFFMCLPFVHTVAEVLNSLLLASVLVGGATLGKHQAPKEGA